MSQWTATSLGQIANIIIGGTPSTSVAEYWNPPEIDWVTAKDISEAPTAKIYETERHISKAGFENSSAKMLPKLATVLIARGATMGKCCMLGRSMALNQTCYGIVAKEGTNPTFLYYYLSNLYETFRNMSHGSVFDTVIGSGLRSLEVKIPPLPTQRRIAEILGRLDDKIEVNRRINRTLEAMAQALFRHHFVEFGPYQAELVESEAGLIPRGWRIGTLGEIARNMRNGVDPTTIDGETPYIGLADMPQGSITLDMWGKAGDSISGKNLISKGQFLFGKLRPYFKKVGVVPVDGVCSTDILVIEPRNEAFYGLVLCQLSDQDFIDYTTSVSDGTRMPRVSWNMMDKYPMILPDFETAKSFSNTVRRWTEIITHNVMENRKLAEIRDYLLPRLLSGEIET